VFHHGGVSPTAGDLSLLLFTPAFARALIELGLEDARRWVEESHELEGLWQVGPLR
jgi:hypothetical protein